jgi:hypothetical protein
MVMVEQHQDSGGVQRGWAGSSAEQSGALVWGFVSCGTRSRARRQPDRQSGVVLGPTHLAVCRCGADTLSGVSVRGPTHLAVCRCGASYDGMRCGRSGGRVPTGPDTCRLRVCRCGGAFKAGPNRARHMPSWGCVGSIQGEAGPNTVGLDTCCVGVAVSVWGFI